MSALLALEFRLFWNSCRTQLKYCWVFLLMMAIPALTSETVPLGVMGSWFIAPAFLLIISGMYVIQKAEPIAWLAPLKRLTRLGARIGLFSMLAVLYMATCLAFYPLTGNRPPGSWGLLALHLWLCFMGSSSLLFILAHLTRSQHGFIQSLAFILSITPGFGMSVGHAIHGAPLWTFAAESGALVVFLLFNLHLHQDMEAANRVRKNDIPETPRHHQRNASSDPFSADSPNQVALPLRPTPEPLPVQSTRRLDHAADPGPVLFGSLFAYVSIWLGMGGWIAASFVPMPFFYLFVSFMLMQINCMKIFQHWAPFQSSPIPRATVLRRVFVPFLILWAVTLGIQCGTTWYDSTSVLTDSADRFSLPFVKRDFVVFLPPQLRPSSRENAFPDSPREVASLMSQALHAGYGLIVPEEEILAIRPAGSSDPSTDRIRAIWLRDVEKRWEMPIRMKLILWRVAAGLLSLLLFLTSITTMIPGYLPKWKIRIYNSLYVIFFLVPAVTLAYSRIVPVIPVWLRVLYGEIFDRPWILIALLIPVTSLLLIRHARVFCVSALDLSHLKRRASLASESMF